MTHRKEEKEEGEVLWPSAIYADHYTLTCFSAADDRNVCGGVCGGVIALCKTNTSAEHIQGIL